MDVSYNGSVLNVDGKSVGFPFDIRKVLTEGDLIFVLLSIPIEKKYRHESTNLYGLRKDKVIWQIQDPHEVYPYDYCPFESIWLEDGKLGASDFFMHSGFSSAKRPAGWQASCLPDGGKIGRVPYSGACPAVMLLVLGDRKDSGCA